MKGDRGMDSSDAGGGGSGGCDFADILRGAGGRAGSGGTVEWRELEASMDEASERSLLARSCRRGGACAGGSAPMAARCSGTTSSGVEKRTLLKAGAGAADEAVDGASVAHVAVTWMPLPLAVGSDGEQDLLLLSSSASRATIVWSTPSNMGLTKESADFRD